MGLMRRLVLGDLDLTDYPFSVEFDEDHGSPENVYDTLVSMLADGELSSSDRVNNRSITLSVLVEGPTLADLAAAEAALIAECEKQRNTLSVDPGDSFASVSVFDTFRVQATLQYDPNLEQANFRRYSLTIPARPHARGEDLVVTPAQVTATETVFDDGSSATGWSYGSGASSVASVSGKIVLTSTNLFVDLRRAGSVTVASDRYVSIQWTSSATIHTGPTIRLDSSLLAEVSRSEVSAGVFLSFYAIPAGMTSFATLKVEAIWQGTAGPSRTFSVDAVSKWTAIPFVGTARQKALSLVPGGSVRTQGSIQVAHDTDALGTVIVYTHRSDTGYLPPLRPWLVSSMSVGTDAARISGEYNAVGETAEGDATVFELPAPVLPQGRTEVWAWLKCDTTTTLNVYTNVRAWMGSTSVGYYALPTTPVAFVTNVYRLVNLGVFTSPVAQMGPSGKLRITIDRGPVVGGNLEIDEAYLFAMDEGRLSIVDCDTGTAASGGPSSRLWIDAPSQDNGGRGDIRRGFAADGSDAWHAGENADVWQTPNFDPTGTSVFVVTSNATDAETSLTHYRRFHTHVSDS